MPKTGEAIAQKNAVDAVKAMQAEERKLRAQAKAERAKNVLESQGFKDAMEDIHVSINREMDVCNTMDHAACANLVMQRQVCNKIIRHLIATAKGGQVEAYNAAQTAKTV